jgi:ribulose kinase
LEELTWKRKNVILQALACREASVRRYACALFRQQKLIPETSEASLLGAAMLGFTGIGVYSDVRTALKSMVRAKSVETPHDMTAEQAYNRFLKWASQIM